MGDTMSKRAVDGRFTLPATTIVMPAFNEGQVIGSVIREIHDICDLPILVVDDASTDDTVARAEAAGATVISLPVQLGAWGATQTGLRYALRHHFEFVISMDADGQHEARCLLELAQPVLRGEADVCIGACTSRGSPMRKFAWILMKKVSGLIPGGHYIGIESIQPQGHHRDSQGGVPRSWSIRISVCCCYFSRVDSGSLMWRWV